MVNQRLRNHPLYFECVRMRIRETELFREEEELRKMGAKSAKFLKSCRKFARARKTMKEVEKVLSED